MESNHKIILRKNLMFIVENLSPDDVFLAYLRQEIFSQSTYDDIVKFKERNTDHAASSKIIEQLRRSGPKAYYAFMGALVETGQEFIIEKIDECYYKQLPIEAPMDTETASSGNNVISTPSLISQPTPENESAAHAQYVPGQPPQSHHPHQLHQTHHPHQQHHPKSTKDETDAFIDFSTLKCVSADDVNKIIDEKLSYPMKSSPRGRMLIINNEMFIPQDIADRAGTFYDATNCKNLFTELGFTVSCLQNLTKSKFLSTIESERTSEDHKKADAFILVILSHGAEGEIITIDGQKINISNDIISRFDGNNCPALIGKPKIFIFQACQGRGSTQGIPQADGDQADIYDTLIDADDTDHVPVLTAHEKADMLMLYATVQGFKAYRNTLLGAWFIRDFLTAVRDHAHNSHLSEIVTIACSKIRDRKIKYGGFVQLSEQRSTLDRKLYLLPGYVKHNE